MRSDRGVGRVRSETEANLDRAVFAAPFLPALRTRLGERGILEVLLPRAIPLFCPLWSSEWDHAYSQSGIIPAGVVLLASSAE